MTDPSADLERAKAKLTVARNAKTRLRPWERIAVEALCDAVESVVAALEKMEDK